MSVKHVGVIGDGLGVMCGSKQKNSEKSGKFFFHHKKKCFWVENGKVCLEMGNKPHK